MIGSESNLETPRWFVLNHIGIAFQDMAGKAVDRFNACENCDLELFAPTYVVREEKNGEIKMRTANLTFHYVFVRGTLPEIKMLCSRSNGFSFLIDYSNPEQRYAVISDHAMVNFKNIARAYRNCLPYFPLDDIDLEEGDLVEVVNGDFPGLIGTYMPKAKSNSGNIVLNVYNNVGTIAFNVRASDVRVLEFSHKSTRANDQIDAFVPHLLKALRFCDRDEALPPSLAAKLSVFCSRMGVVKLNNRKLDARLQALLFGANHILGNVAEATEARARFDRLKDAVTNRWTAALTVLIFAVIDKDSARLNTAKATLEKIGPSSKTQQMLLDEYGYYTT